MRIYLYLIAGITSVLLGWNLGQFLLTDVGLLQSAPEVVLFPCVAISLAMGMVLNEIFISSPTRPKLCLRKVIIPCLIAFALGLILGLVAGGIAQILFLPVFDVSARIVRMIGWLLIGLSVGLAEGLTWRWETVEAGDKKRFWQRFITSVVGASVASLVAASLFEYLRSLLNQMPELLQLAEDPIGFSLLGLLLGLTFSLTSSPSYLVALRAGAGFEYIGDVFAHIMPEPENVEKAYPYINQSVLTFVSDSSADKIEEGLSIKLPAKGTLKIGSDGDCQIYIPSLPANIANLEIKSREAILVPNFRYFNLIEINGEPLKSKKNVRLKHNYLVTFYSLNHPENSDTSESINREKIYRFVYYNRFLDPQA